MNESLEDEMFGDSRWRICYNSRMSAIRIRKTIDSDTLHLPELGPFIGHTVDIVIQDESQTATVRSDVIPGMGDWDALLKASQHLQDYDYDAQQDQDARDLRDAQERMR